MADGILIARMMPPHDGHKKLVDFATRYVERLRILVSSLENDPIGGERRLDWARRLYGAQCQIELVDLPIEASAVSGWVEHIRGLKGWVPKFLFSAERLGKPLAQELEAHLVTVDPPFRSAELVSDSIRQNPSAHWHRLPGSIRRDFLKRVCVFGPESTGKSTLCEKLSRHYRTVAVPEYARTYLEQKDGEYELSDVVLVARGQLASEHAYSTRARRLLFCDTDLLTLKIWSDWLFGECDDWLEERLDQERYDLYLLTCADVPWVEDEIRYLPNDRENFEQKCEQVLQKYDCTYVKLSGDWEVRFENAVKLIDELLSDPWDLTRK